MTNSHGLFQTTGPKTIGREEKRTSNDFKESWIDDISSMFLDFSGDIWVCGNSADHNLGLPGERKKGEDVDFQKNPELTNIKKILGKNASAAFFEDNKNQVLVTGENHHDQLGIGEDERTMPRVVPDLKADKIKKLICTNEQSTFIIQTGGSVLACGRNDYGQLGLKHNKRCTQFTPVPDLKDVEDIYSFIQRTFFKLSNGTVLSCGQNHSPRPEGEEDKPQYHFLTPILKECKIKSIQENGSITAFLTEKKEAFILGNMKGLREKEDANAPFKIDMFNILDIQMGYNCLYLLTEDGTVLAVGDSKEEQLAGDFSKLSIVPGLRDITKLKVAPASHIVALDKDGQVYVTPIPTQLGGYGFKKEGHSIREINTGGKKAIDIAAGSYHTILTMEDHSLLGCSIKSNIPDWMNQLKEKEPSSSLRFGKK
jgi:alpha-tubulin suppressor-like RCC1 family protein